ncbi:hypothetical protein BASA81_007884 [Batrachochytrium salamandrivorans]|nr:hypothetical protein BASA81_007884 [Batrachochytrium salamandrivorans]
MATLVAVVTSEAQEPMPAKERKFGCGWFLATMTLGLMLFFVRYFTPEYEAVRVISPEQQVSAPRSMPTLVYDEIDLINHRYLIFNPSGGMSSQILELGNAMGLAKRLNRTLYVSRIAKHTNHLLSYLNQGEASTFPADRLLDFNLLSRYVRVVPLNTTTKQFMKQFELQSGERAQRQVTAQYKFGSLVELSKSQAGVISLSGNYMWDPFFTQSEMDEIAQHVTFSPYLRKLAVQLVKDKFPNGKFYAIHGRLGDERHLWQGKSSLAILNRKRVSDTWDFINHPVYLASDAPKDKFFDPVRKAFSKSKVVTLADMDATGELQEFKRLFPIKEVRLDILGILDKLICAQAEEFEGSLFSTFTWDIERIRKYKAVLFPELD